MKFEYFFSLALTKIDNFTRADSLARIYRHVFETQGKEVMQKLADQTIDKGKLNLSGANLFGIKLHNLLFYDVDFRNVNFQNSAISTEFKKCTLKGSDFSKSHIKTTDFYECNMSDCKFVDTKINDLVFTESNLRRSDFSNTSRSKKSNLIGVNFDVCEMDYANFSNQRIKISDFYNCRLNDANFSNVHFDTCDLEDSILYGSNVTGAKFDKATLETINEVDGAPDKIKKLLMFA